MQSGHNHLFLEFRWHEMGRRSRKKTSESNVNQQFVSSPLIERHWFSRKISNSNLFFVKKCQIQAAFCETFVITCVFLSESKCFSVAFIGLRETVISCVNLFFLPSYQILVFNLTNSLVFKAWNYPLITRKIIELIHENTLACQVSRRCQARF